jgi:predicted metal-dependent peptidase
MRKELREAEAVAKMQGKGPGWMERVMGNADHQRVPWYDVLEQYLKSMTKADYSWRRWSKREFTKAGILSPDLYQPAMGGMVVFVDCSGSVSGKELQVFSKHFRDIIEQVKPAWVQAVYWDEIPYPPYERFERCEFDEDTTRLKPSGGGGTDFTYFAKFIEDEVDEPPELVICLTDMCTTFGRAPEMPMIWLSSSSIDKAPYGEVIQIN